MVLDRNSLLETMKLKTEEVELDGGKVIVSELSGPDYIKLYSDPANQKATGRITKVNGKDEPEMTIEMGRFQAALIVYGVVDTDGKRIFKDEDIDLVARGSQGPFLKLAEVARKLNGFNGEEVKNSDGNQSEFSFSDCA